MATSANATVTTSRDSTGSACVPMPKCRAKPFHSTKPDAMATAKMRSGTIEPKIGPAYATNSGCGFRERSVRLISNGKRLTFSTAPPDATAASTWPASCTACMANQLASNVRVASAVRAMRCVVRRPSRAIATENTVQQAENASTSNTSPCGSGRSGMTVSRIGSERSEATEIPALQVKSPGRLLPGADAVVWLGGHARTPRVSNARVGQPTRTHARSTELPLATAGSEDGRQYGEWQATLVGQRQSRTPPWCDRRTATNRCRWPSFHPSHEHCRRHSMATSSAIRTHRLRM